MDIVIFNFESGSSTDAISYLMPFIVALVSAAIALILKDAFVSWRRKHLHDSIKIEVAKNKQSLRVSNNGSQTLVNARPALTISDIDQSRVQDEVALRRKDGNLTLRSFGAGNREIRDGLLVWSRVVDGKNISQANLQQGECASIEVVRTLNVFLSAEDTSAIPAVAAEVASEQGFASDSGGQSNSRIFFVSQSDDKPLNVECSIAIYSDNAKPVRVSLVLSLEGSASLSLA